MEKTVRSFFLTICLVLSAFMPTAVYAVTVPVNSEDEYDYELAEGIFYTGETAKRHVPGGYGTLTFRTSDPSGVPDIVIAGTFEGDRIRNAVLCQSEELLFWGEMRYSVNQKKGSYIVLVKGEIFDGEGNLTGEVTEDSPLTINCLTGNPAYLKGSGPIKRHVDPVSASRYVLLSGNGIESGSSTLEVEGKSWKVSPEEFRFRWGEYTFGVGDYSKGIGKEVSFGETATSQYTISEELDAFAQIGKIEGNDLLSVLRYMSASVPMTGKGFKYYTSDRGLTAHVHEKDYVYQENGGWCFETSLPVVGPMEMVQNREYGIKSDQYGLYGFFGSKNQLYSMPFEVCISRPSYELTCKICRDKLTLISVGTIQMQGETDTYMNPVAPPVTPFSVKDLVFGNREGAAGGGGTLSEGASHTVTLPFLGVETAWTVSATTKEWVTPISTAGTSIIVNGRKYSEAGDAFPPFRAVRTVTQSVDLKDVAQKKGWTVQLLMEQLFETGLDGLIATSKSDIIRIGKGAGMKD
ncbi:MAG: hypothetical protein IJ161_07960 [Bacteroidales bacterium]|nr:hypothetical protein [Bacteroidales bacterium]